MKNKFIYCFLIFFANIIRANEFELLNEYNLLYTDLINIRTWGYKSFFDITHSRANENINFSPGRLISRSNNFDFSIIGEGFFKIRLENDLIGFTRSGEFLVDSNGNIVTRQGYALYDNINLGNTYLPDSLKVYRDGTIFIDIVRENNIIENISVGELLVYKVSNENLAHYNGSIYILKDNIEYIEKISCNTHIIQGYLECSNLEVLPAIIRLYFIMSLLNEETISNIGFKKELVKILIQNYNEEHVYFIEWVIPFLRYDY